jgi:hypothetical protein
VSDTSLSKIYVDIDNCVFQDENDALSVINHDFSKRAFIAAGKPVFIENVRVLREQMN